MKQTIRLRESELRRMIAESVKRVLNEANGYVSHDVNLTNDIKRLKSVINRIESCPGFELFCKQNGFGDFPLYHINEELSKIIMNINNLRSDDNISDYSRTHKLYGPFYPPNKSGFYGDTFLIQVFYSIQSTLNAIRKSRRWDEFNEENFNDYPLDEALKIVGNLIEQIEQSV